jgi:SAM-dependent methyltransferase
MVLTKQQDAYGQMFCDHLKGKPSAEVVERDDGLISLTSGSPSYFAEFKDWPPHQRAAMRFARGRVLDVGCGAGRCCLYLQKRGHQVVGIDVSPLGIKVCRQRGVKDARVVPVARISRQLGRFDTVLMMGGNFGLFGNRSRARWLLRRLRAMTSPNARIVAESSDVYQTEDPIHLQYHRQNRRRGRMSGQIRLRVRYRQFSTPWFDYLIVSPEEMKRIVAGTGWRVHRLIKSTGPVHVAVIEKLPRNVEVVSRPRGRKLSKTKC